MTRPRSLTTLLLSAALVLSSSIAATAQSDDEPGWLVVVHGQVTDATAGGLTLDTGDRGIAFTDRPDRAVRLFDVPTWVGLAWDEDGEFAVDPPNAALVDETEDALAIIEITDATWADGLVMMDVTYLEGDAPAIGDLVALTVDQSDNDGIWT